MRYPPLTVRGRAAPGRRRWSPSRTAAPTPGPRRRVAELMDLVRARAGRCRAARPAGSGHALPGPRAAVGVARRARGPVRRRPLPHGRGAAAAAHRGLSQRRRPACAAPRGRPPRCPGCGIRYGQPARAAPGAAARPGPPPGRGRGRPAGPRRRPRWSSPPRGPAARRANAAVARAAAAWRRGPGLARRGSRVRVGRLADRPPRRWRAAAGRRAAGSPSRPTCWRPGVFADRVASSRWPPGPPPCRPRSAPRPRWQTWSIAALDLPGRSPAACGASGSSRSCRDSVQSNGGGEGGAREWTVPRAPHVTHEVSIRSRRWPGTTWPMTRRCRAALRREGARGLGRAGCTSWASGAGSARDAGARPAGQRAPPGAAHARRTRPPDRRGRVPPRLARADGHRRRPRAARGALGGRHARRARGPGRQVLRVDAGRGRARLPDLHDLRRGAGAAARARASPAGSSRCSAPAATTPGCGFPDGKAGLLAGMAHDREAGRLRRPGQHHQGRPGRRRLPAHRAQVVLLRAHVRPVPGPGPGPGGADLLPAPPGAARRHPQRHAHPAAQGQAGQPVQRLVGGRVRRRVRLAGRRAGPGRAPRSSRWSARPGWTASSAARPRSG